MRHARKSWAGRAERAAVVLMILGVLMVVQPWSHPLFGHGFWVTLLGLLGYYAATKLAGLAGETWAAGNDPGDAGPADWGRDGRDQVIGQGMGFGPGAGAGPGFGPDAGFSADPASGGAEAIGSGGTRPDRGATPPSPGFPGIPFNGGGA